MNENRPGQIMRHIRLPTHEDGDLNGIAICIDGMTMINDDMKAATVEYLKNRFVDNYKQHKGR